MTNCLKEKNDEKLSLQYIHTQTFCLSTVWEKFEAHLFLLEAYSNSITLSKTAAYKKATRVGCS